MRVGIICEGSTDFAVLEHLAFEVVSATECKLLQPDFDRLQGPGDPMSGPGWQGVRKFLQKNGTALGLPVYDLIIIQVDASIRTLPGVREGLSKAGTDQDPLQPLCDLVKSWAGNNLPAKAIIVLPREDLEAWLVAAHTNISRPEEVGSPADLLAQKGILPMVRGQPQKKEERYRELAVSLGRMLKIKRRLSSVRELERTVDRMRAVKRSSR